MIETLFNYQNYKMKNLKSFPIKFCFEKKNQLFLKVFDKCFLMCRN